MQFVIICVLVTAIPAVLVADCPTPSIILTSEDGRNISLTYDGKHEVRLTVSIGDVEDSSTSAYVVYGAQ